MNPAAYQEMAAQEATHWWYVGRRQILASALSALALPPQARLLEIGAGTGGNLAMLARHGQVQAVEDNPEARAIAQARHPELAISPGRLPGPLPGPEGHFDLICLLDVLEHIEQDRQALRALAARLAPGGRILLTVPAYQWLFGAHDRFHHHFRRYSAGGLREAAADAGLHVRHMSHFNTLLFPAAAAVRALERLGIIRPGAGTSQPGRIANRLLTSAFGAEAAFVMRPGLPFGLSLLAVLEQAETPQP